MPLQYEFRREMLRREPSLGQVEAIASMTATTIVVNRLAVGTVLSGKFIEKWLVRAESTAAADRVRMCSNYTASSGTLTHAGTNYSDTTAGTESVEIHEQEPYLLDLGIQLALKETRFLSREFLPLNLSGRNWLGDLDWITGPSEIARIGRRASPVLTRNRHMELWNGYQTITVGALQPDYWTLAGTSATFARSTTRRRGGYSLSVVRSGTDATVGVVIPIQESGVTGDSLRGQTVTGVAVSRSANASSHRVRVTSEDGSGVVLSTTNSSYHAGGGVWAETSAQHIVHASAEQLRVSFREEVNETGLLDELYLCVGTLDDTIRRDAWIPIWDTYRRTFEQGQPLLNFGPITSTQQLAVESYRPYAQFTQSRVDAGTADSDTSDAPLELIAEGALFHLYAGLEPDWREAKTVNGAKARVHWGMWSALRAQHLHTEQQRDAGLSFPPRMQQSVSARIR